MAAALRMPRIPQKQTNEHTRTVAKIYLFSVLTTKIWKSCVNKGHIYVWGGPLGPPKILRGILAAQYSLLPNGINLVAFIIWQQQVWGLT